MMGISKLKLNSFISKKYIEIIIFALVGIITFFFIYGLTPLKVTYTDWLKGHGDLTQQYIGWYTFRLDPWTFPIGKFTSLGHPFGNAISFTDSIPLFAIPFKIFNPILPKDFQFFGIWGLFCFAMQGIFAGLLLSLWTKNRFLVIIGTLFFTFSPIMISRSFAHNSLSGHWIILFALYLFFRAQNEKISVLSWILVCVLAILIHPYFIFMVLIIYIGSEINNFILNKNILSILKRFFLVILSIILIGWIIGLFFLNTSVGTSDFGYWSMNLNAMFNPNGWSKFILKDLPVVSKGQTAGAGFQYLGLGMLILLLIVLFIRLMGKSSFNRNNFKKMAGLFFIILPLFFFSLSNKITFANKVLININLPHIVLKIFSIFHGSGRMFWPIYYLIFVFVFITLFQKLRDRIEQKKLIIILIILFILQIGDMSGALKKKSSLFSTKITYSNQLDYGFWTKVAQKYHHIVFLPPVSSNVNDLCIFSLYALKNGMTFNTGFFSRWSKEKPQKYASKLINDIKKGSLNKDILYIVNDPILFRELADIIQKKQIGYVYNVDNFNIITTFSPTN